jgi:N-acetylmuramoyl-L-alanine amidase
MTQLTFHFRGGVALAALTILLPAAAWAQTAQARYSGAKERDDKVRLEIAAAAAQAPPSTRTPIITEARAVIAAYEGLVRADRSSGYADNALFNAASLADALHERFGLTTDRDAAQRLYKRLAAEYPTAPLARQAAPRVARLENTAAARKVIVPAEGEDAPAIATAVVAAPALATGRAKLLSIDRVLMPDLVRVTLALDREVPYKEETLTGPARVFFDLRNVEAAPVLLDAVLRYPSDLVRQIRVGRHPNTTRVVLDLEGVGRHSVYALYNPFRIVIDAEAPVAAAKAAPPPVPAAPPVVVTDAPVVPSVVPASAPAGASAGKPAPAAPAPGAPASAAGAASASAVGAASVSAAGAATADKTADKTAGKPAPGAPSPGAPAPSAPSAPGINAVGGFSIARQLGLGISRIVIDAGHGGHDPGAQARGINEAELTLDIALRLEELLEKEAGLEVILTRRTDVYIPLEERTAIANRENADLFLSIHANTSRNSSARGVETYFLSFAASPEAEAVAARENSSHAGEMHKLPDIVRAITLNNKLDESRDLAGMVQEALVTRLRRSSKAVQNRGVKKAPFVVLIGAEMPSVLAEVSFMSNKQELQLLKSAQYKQRIAEALQAAVLRYRRSLKGSATAAAR